MSLRRRLAGPLCVHPMGCWHTESQKKNIILPFKGAHKNRPVVAGSWDPTCPLQAQGTPRQAKSRKIGKIIVCKNQRFRKGVGGRGLATDSARNTAKNVPQNCVLLLIRGHRKKGAEKRPESLFSGWIALCQPPPAPFRNL